jgi:hypothetical protein
MTKAAISKVIKDNIKELTEAWMRLVREDQRIISDAQLSSVELMDHVPAIIDELSSLIEWDQQPHTKNTHEARASVYTRIHQGYRGQDLIREISLLRLTLLDHLVTGCAKIPLDLTLDEYIRTAKIINLYLDEEMRYAISVYTSLSKSSLTNYS